ncbi:MAG: two-component system sensor histidine kinase FlrB [Halioglobus sp.]|jgi:two-component system sensor histidine kinase FlrB
MSQPKPLSASNLEEAFAAFSRVSHELDVTYRELETKVAALTDELAQARSAKLLELAEKERLAHRLSSLVSALPGGVLILDPQQVVRDANPQAIQLLGEELLGEPWGDVLFRASGCRELHTRELVLSNGKRYSVFSQPLDNLGDHVILITDVSEIHHLQEQLGRKKRLTALGEMAARLAHQIRTPLSTTTLYLSQLGRHDLPAEQRQDISSRVSQRLSHMGNLLDSMLSFVRGGAPVKDVIYLDQVLKDFRSTVMPQLTGKGASVSVPTVDHTLTVMGDQDELVGALSNLAMNALEASSEPLALELWVGALNDEWLQIRVRDNGPGISEDILDRIFDPFFTTRAQGTGLGLAVVAMTVSNHGGEITVHNRAAGGAEFLINLPIGEYAAASLDNANNNTNDGEIADE